MVSVCSCVQDFWRKRSAVIIIIMVDFTSDLVVTTGGATAGFSLSRCCRLRAVVALCSKVLILCLLSIRWAKRSPRRFANNTQEQTRLRDTNSKRVIVIVVGVIRRVVGVFARHPIWGSSKSFFCFPSLLLRFVVNATGDEGFLK